MISVFVSSTFRDMQAERDILQKKVLPEIRSFCHEYGESINFLDLRWGVDTSKLEDEDKSEKVLNVCLDQIDRCKPYIIVLLGQRYGWIPDYQLIEKAITTKEYVDDGLKKSVTALEIEYGALSRTADADKYLFFFREDLPIEEMPDDIKESFGSESEAHAAKLKELKKRIVAAFPERVFSYSLDWANNRLTGYDDFANIVTANLKSVIRNQLAHKKELSLGERRLKESLRYIKEQQFYFSGRERIVRRIADMTSDYRLIILPGEAGTGKTAIASELVNVLGDDDTIVIPVICGLTSDSRSAEAVMHLVCSILEEQCGEDNINDNMDVLTLCRYWASLIDRVCSDGKKLVIIIDGLDRLDDDDLNMHLNFLPKAIHSNCTIIVTCRDNYQLPRFYNYKAAVEPIPPAEVGEVLDIIRHTLEIHAKELDAASRLALMTEKNAYTNLLYLKLMLRRIINMDSDDFRGIVERGDGMTAISEYITDLIRKSPNDVKGVVDSLCEEVIKYVAPEQTKIVLDLVALTENGLNQIQIQDFFRYHGLEWNELEFARLQKYMYGFVYEHENFNFAYPEIRTVILGKMNNKYKINLNKMLIEYLNSLPDDDYLKVFNYIKCCCYADDKQSAVNYLNRMGRSDNSHAVNLLSRYIGLFLLNRNDEWFGKLFGNGVELNAEYSMVDFISLHLLPDMQKSNAVNEKMLNIAYMISTNNVRLARSIIDKIQRESTFSDSTISLHEDKTAAFFQKVGENIKTFESANYTLGSAMAASSSCCQSVYDYDTAFMYSCQALALYMNLRESHPDSDKIRLDLVECINSTARLALSFGVLNGTMNLCESALSLCEENNHEALNDSDSNFRERQFRIEKSESLNLLGNAYCTSGDLDKAVDYQEHAIQIIKEYSARKDDTLLLRTLCKIYEDYGVILQKAERYEDAEKVLDLSNDIINGTEIAHDYYDSLSLRSEHVLHRGILLSSEGRYAEAVSDLTMCIGWMEELSQQYNTPPNQHMLANANMAFASTMESIGNYDEAERYCEKAGELLENLVGENNNVASLASLLEVCVLMGKIKMRLNDSAANEFFIEGNRIKEQIDSFKTTKESLLVKYITMLRS